MPIERDEKGFLVWPETHGGPSLGLESEHLQECIQEILSRGLKGAFGTVPFFYEKDLSFLQRMPDLTSLEVYDVKLSDVSDLYSLKKLESLRINAERPAIQFQRIPTLRILVVEFHPGDTGIDDIEGLSFLHLWRYKIAKSKKPQFLLPNSLEHFGLFWSDIDSLDHFGVCENVKELEIARCRNLQSLGDFSTNFPNVQRLIVEASGRLSESAIREGIAQHKRIEFVFGANKVLVDKGRGGASLWTNLQPV